jgi:hypothetical protein
LNNDDPDRPDATDVFHTMPVSLIGERDERAELSTRGLSYYHPFLDDVLRAILPHDLVLLGAPTGMGKTDLSLAIAMSNAIRGKRVAYFALEAEPRELERRTKFSWLSTEAYRRNLERKGEINYADWLLHKCEDIVGGLNDEADRHIAKNMRSLWTFYRGQHFGQQDLKKQIEKMQELVDLMVVDHLHYVDFDSTDESEARALGDTVKVIRDVSLRIGKPIILVAHLRKRDQRSKQIIPAIDDFHGSSNITKICTQVITIEKAHSIEAPKWWLAPTFMSVLKDRRAGAPPFVALTNFDRRTRRYEETYTLGRLVKGGTEWEQIKPSDRPGWANGHTQMEMEL